MGKTLVEGVPNRTPTACGTSDGDNCPNGDVKSILGLFVQLACAQDWPGKLPIVYEKIVVPYTLMRSNAFVARLSAWLLGSNTPAATVSRREGIHKPTAARDVVLKKLRAIGILSKFRFAK